ncbi:MAG: glutamine--fructose-6-phosphate transaminase (isomerizing) [bacterium]|nr:glutamine--fructose-6-phosphate transaminase (isomerizing) [bacterium]
MCGIFGYIGTNQHASTFILEGLKSLEYRGYDSWGIALQKDDGTVHITKHPGKIGDAKAPNVLSSLGIGHTRWATHGGISTENAHPHTDCTGEVVLVHNGIVENFALLKKELSLKGHLFKSETDSEVIAHFVEEMSKTSDDLDEIMKQTKQTIDGMNAVIILFPKKQLFYIIKNGSPIVIGKASDGYYIASDATAILPHTKEVYFLEDGESAKLTRDSLIILDAYGKEKEPAFISLPYDAQLASKGNYDYFMLKEIAEQPTILRAISQNAHAEVSKAAKLIKDAFGTYLIGCGTASYAALAGTYLFSKIAKRHVNNSIGSEFTYLVDFLTNKSLIIPLSQSGETIDTISAVDHAREKGAHILAITNSIGSTLYRKANDNILLNAGPEKAVASTKAYTAKIAYLYLIAHEINGTYKNGISNLNLAIDAIVQLLHEQDAIRKIVDDIKNQKHIFILGRGLSYPAALESALKIKEVSYVHAEGFAAGELKHGVLALVEKGTPIILFNPHDETYEDTLSAAYEVRARGGYVIGLAHDNHEAYDEYIHIPDCQDATVLPNVVVAQLMGYYLAIAKGFDPDKPRNLAKSVVVK